MVQRVRYSVYGNNHHRKKKRNNIGGNIKTCFVDSNIIAYWMMAKDINVNVFNKLRIPRDFVNVYSDRYNSSISFIDKIVDGSFENKFDFITYDFNIFEIAKAIKDEIKTLYLFKKGEPISKWSKSNSEKFDEEIISIIYSYYSNLQDILFGEEKIKLETIPFAVGGKTYASYYDFYNYILFRIPELSTQDALIISGCYVDNIDYLISEDSRLQKAWKEFIKDDKEIKTKTKLEIKKPGDTTFYTSKK